MGLMHEVHQIGGCMTMELSQLWNGEKKKKTKGKKRYTSDNSFLTNY